MVDNGSEFEEEDEEDYDDYGLYFDKWFRFHNLFLPGDNDIESDDKDITDEQEGETDQKTEVEGDGEGDEETDNGVSDDDDVSIIEDEVEGDTPAGADGNDDGNDDDDDDVEDDADGDIPLIPKRSCFPFCEVHKNKKEKKPKKDKKETLWRVVARGNGLFFARMHLFTDDTFSKAWMYPPSLKTNDTIYAGVVLANGPSEATISLTRY